MKLKLPVPPSLDVTHVKEELSDSSDEDMVDTDSAANETAAEEGVSSVASTVRPAASFVSRRGRAAQSALTGHAATSRQQVSVLHCISLI